MARKPNLVGALFLASKRMCGIVIGVGGWVLLVTHDGVFASASECVFFIDVARLRL
jgi:hypothetical protein